MGKPESTAIGNQDPTKRGLGRAQAVHVEPRINSEVTVQQVKDRRVAEAR